MRFVIAIVLFSLLTAQNIIYDDNQVADIYITIDPASLQWMYTNVDSDSEHVATFRMVNAYFDEIVDSIGFRLRGNTSRVAQKKSFKVSFDTFFEGREFHGMDKLNLNGEHNDPSIVRSKLCWDFYQKIGVVSSRANHVRLYINDEYYGLYISVEHIDNEFLSRNFDDDSGNLWKCLYPADLDYISENPDDYKFAPYGRRAYDLKTNESQDDYSQLAHLISVLNLTPIVNLPDSLESILNVPLVLKYFAVNLLTGSWDDYRFLKNNYYLYHEPTLNQFQLIPYDYDNSFGVDWFEIDWWTVDPYSYANNDGTTRPLSERLFSINQYKCLFSHFLEFYSENVFDLSQWEDRIDSLRAMITPAAELDTYRTLDYGFSMDDFNNSYSAEGYSNQHVKTGIKEFINERNTSLTDQLAFPISPPIAYQIDWEPKYPLPTDSIHVFAAVYGVNQLTEVTIKYHPSNLTVIEEYAMIQQPVSNTYLVEEADRWVGTIPPLGEGGSGRFQVYVRDNISLNETYPRNRFITLNTNTQYDAPVVINEWLALNNSINMDESSEYDDWVELYNSGEVAYDLSGFYLTDDPNELNQWQIPVGTVIPSHGYLLIWCDNDPAQGDLHATFKISGDGEYLALVQPDGVTAMDAYSFGAQQEDISYGRTSDGMNNWGFLSPTPGSENQTLNIEPASIPVQFNLRNYPNPFNPITTIRYEIPWDSQTKLIVYDITGREIAKLVNKVQKAGIHHIQFDASQLSSGIYLYQLQSDKVDIKRKMTVLK